MITGRRSEQRMPGGGSRWNAGKDLSLGAAAHRAGRRGDVRSAAGGPVPPRLAVPALAAGPRRPRVCTYDQLEVASPVAFRDVVGRDSSATVVSGGRDRRRSSTVARRRSADHDDVLRAHLTSLIFTVTVHVPGGAERDARSSGAARRRTRTSAARRARRRRRRRPRAGVKIDLQPGEPGLGAWSTSTRTALGPTTWVKRTCTSTPLSVLRMSCGAPRSLSAVDDAVAAWAGVSASSHG